MVQTRAMLASKPEARAPFNDLTNRRKRKSGMTAKAETNKRRSKPEEPTGEPYSFDVETRRDELACPDYVVPLYEYYRDAEALKSKSVSMYMDFQHDINPRMRAILVDWLLDVHMKFKMTQQTIYLTVHIIDRYLSKCQIGRSRLQLLGVSALFIASKYEEIYPPEVSECTYITDNAYEANEVLEMEMAILRELDWNITAPNAHFWLVRMMRLVGANEAELHCAEYFSQRMLQEYNMLEYKPSLLAAAAAHLTLQGLSQHRDKWPASWEKLTGYGEADLYTCCKAMSYHVNAHTDSSACRSSSNKLAACRKKFAKDDWSRISLLMRCPVLPRRS